MVGKLDFGPERIGVLRGVVFLVGWHLLFLASGLFSVSPEASAWFLPAGWSAAFVAIFGLRAWPWTLLAPTLTGLFFDPDLAAAAADLLPDLRHAVVYGSLGLLLRRMVGTTPLRDLLSTARFQGFSLLAGLLSAMMMTPWTAEGSVREIFALGLGDANGVLLGTPFFLALWTTVPLPWGSEQRDARWRWPQLRRILLWIPPVLLTAALAVALPRLLGWQNPAAYLLLVPVGWIAVRAGAPGLIVALPLVDGAALAVLRLTPTTLAADPLVEFQLLALTLAVAGQLLVAVVADRDRMRREFRMDRQRLETEKERQERQLAGTIEELRKDNLRLELAGEEAREGWHRQAGMLAEMDRSIERSLGEIASAAEHFRQRSLPAEAQRHGEALYQAVTELLRLVTEVRQTDADAVETLRLKPALYPVIARERNRAAGREVAVRFQPHRELPRAIRGHRDSLRQVALSLVSHAVQRAEPGTEVTVTLRCGSPEGAPRDLRMTVTASTAGQSSPGQEGDLWLALCRRIVTTLGGRLEMESSQALVTFWLTLPLEVAPEPPWSEARAQPEARSHLHLLLIHGHPVQRRVVQGIAEDLGYNVWTAADGQAALQELPHHRTDLVLLDAEIRAPDLAHTARAIRQWGAGGEGLPLIALTTAPEALDLEGSDLDDAVGKPLQRDALAAALDHWLCLHLEAPPAPITDEFAVPKGPALDEERLELLRRLGRDQRDVLAELAELFLAQKDDRLEALRGALGAANFEDIRRVAHSLKGSGSNLGASPLARLCGRLERLADTGDLQGCRGLLDAITEETDRVALALRQYIDAPP